MRQAIIPIVLLAAAVPAGATAAPRSVRGADVDSARAPKSQLREVSEVRSGARRVTRYRQVVRGLPVLGSDTTVTEAPGTRGDLLIDGSRPLAAPARATISRARAVRAALGSRDRVGRIAASRAILPGRARARTVWRVAFRTERPLAVIEVLVDARSGKVVRRRNMVRQAAQEARVFDTNALVAKPGPRGSLADNGNAAGPEFDPLYTVEPLLRLDNPDCLDGAYVVVFFGDNLACREDADFTRVVDPDNSGSTIPNTRAFDEFEAGMAYFHIDRTQDYLQGIGVLDANNRRTHVDVNQIPDDNSFYIPSVSGQGTGSLLFGAGGVDDAEDGEVIVHEYGHAIQDNQVPGFGATAQGGAMGEGFSDYLAAAIAKTFAPRATHDPCFAEWDFADLAPFIDPPCLRRVDRNTTLAQAQARQGCSNPSEFIYCAGEAWSGALWDIRAQVGGATADRKVVQSHDSLTPQSDLHAGSLALVAAYAGHPSQSFVRTLLSQRGLLDVERLDNTPASATTLAVPGTRNGYLQFGRDNDDVYRLGLTARRAVVVRLRGSGHDFDLRLLRPGSSGVNQTGAPVVDAQTSGSNENLFYNTPDTGLYYLAVRAFQGQGFYTVTVLMDGDTDTVPDVDDNCVLAVNPGQEDSDRDRVGDDCDRFPSDRANDVDRDGLAADEDNCPRNSNRGQADWDDDDRGDACDLSALVRLRRLRTRGSRITMRATYRPTLLRSRAVTLRYQGRACRRCKYGKLKKARRGKARGSGRVDFTVKVRRGLSYRFVATLRDRRFKARSGALSLRLR